MRGLDDIVTLKLVVSDELPTELVPSLRDVRDLVSDLQRAAQHAMEEALALIKSDGNSAAMSDRLTSFEEREATIGTPEYLELDRRYRA